MPDFFVDTILSGSYNYNFDKFKEKINSGGGSIRRISHVDRVGGNAVNVAQALGKIGVSTTLSTISEDKYVKLLNSAFESMSTFASSAIIFWSSVTTRGLISSKLQSEFE